MLIFSTGFLPVNHSIPHREETKDFHVVGLCMPNIGSLNRRLERRINGFYCGKKYFFDTVEHEKACKVKITLYWEKWCQVFKMGKRCT